MRRTVLLGIAVAALAILTTGVAPREVAAVRLATFPPPATITVKMYQLTEIGATTDHFCFPGSRNWGCTAYCNEPTFDPDPCSGGGTAGYPFGTETVTVAIEGTAATNRYLRDVIPQETGPAAYHETAVRAQAIAARTYAYWFVQHPLGGDYHLNNSAEKQMFVPYKFDTLTSDQRTIINNALQDRYYLSQTGDDNPIFAEFFGDRPLATLSTPPYAYLTGVADPISSHPDVPYDGHGHGLSQKGASRWARGNLSAYLGNDLGAWSVSWSERFQILTHYYTGIYVRDANGNVLTPRRRFNVLNASVNGHPLGEVTQRVCTNKVATLTVILQNTGTESWSTSDTGIGYCWNSQCTAGDYLPQAVAPGATLAVTLPIQPSAGNLSLDLYYKPPWSSLAWFAAGVQNDWPWLRQPLDQLLLQCPHLPLINRGAQ